MENGQEAETGCQSEDEFPSGSRKYQGNFCEKLLLCAHGILHFLCAGHLVSTSSDALEIWNIETENFAIPIHRFCISVSLSLTTIYPPSSCFYSLDMSNHLVSLSPFKMPEALHEAPITRSCGCFGEFDFLRLLQLAAAISPD
jgi:hypothetical protein